MKFILRVLQPGHKPRVIESNLRATPSLEDLRKIWEAEVALNSLPGSDLRFHFHITEEEK